MAYLFFVVTFISIVLYLLNKSVDEMYYHKKLKNKHPKNTSIKCPLNNDLLRDFELMNGYCVKCPKNKRTECKQKINKENVSR